MALPAPQPVLSPTSIALRKTVAVASWASAIICAVGPRLIAAKPFYEVSLNAAVLIAAFGFFASIVQDDLPFSIGLVGIIPSLVLTLVVALKFRGIQPEWMSIFLAVLTVLIAGLTVFLPGQRNIWR